MVEYYAAPVPRDFDAVVATSGQRDYTTLQAADDVLDAAAYSMYVKEGTYAAGLTVSTNNVYIFVEAGTVVQAAITLSGTGITLILGAQCDVQGVVTLSGANCSLICLGGVDIDGINVTGNTCHVDGGGWDTISDGGTATHGISVSGDDCIVENIACQTTAGGGNAYYGIRLVGAVRAVVRNTKVIDSDDLGIIVYAASTDCLIDGCTILNSDNHSIHLDSARVRIVGNHLVSSSGRGINCDDDGDNSLIIGNIIQDQNNQAILVDAGCEDVIIDGNRTDGAITDNSGTSTVGDNEATAF